MKHRQCQLPQRSPALSFLCADRQTSVLAEMAEAEGCCEPSYKPNWDTRVGDTTPTRSRLVPALVPQQRTQCQSPWRSVEGRARGGCARAGLELKAAGSTSPADKNSTLVISLPVTGRLRAALSHLSKPVWALSLPGSSGSGELFLQLLVPDDSSSAAALFTASSPEDSGATLIFPLKEKQKERNPKVTQHFVEIRSGIQ